MKNTDIIKLCKYLWNRSANIKQIAKHLDVEWNTAKKTLDLLEVIGYLQVKKVGRETQYSKDNGMTKKQQVEISKIFVNYATNLNDTAYKYEIHFPKGAKQENAESLKESQDKLKELTKRGGHF